jgi:uncharacterized protein
MMAGCVRMRLLGAGLLRIGAGLLLAAGLAACGDPPKPAPAKQGGAPVAAPAAPAQAPAQAQAQANAQTPPPGAPRACPPQPQAWSQQRLQEAVKHARDHGFLWRITRGGHSSYLYGTMHVGKAEWVMPGPETMAALRATDTLALEMDLMDPRIQAELNHEMTTLHGAALPPALEARMRRDAEALCVPWQGLAAMPPELQLAVLDLAAGREAELDPAYAADAVLAGLGHGAHKRMVSLETPAFQMQALVMKSPAETAAYVEDNLKDLESADALALLKRLAQAWADSDYAEIENYRQWCQCERTPAERALMKRMLDERNPAMAAKIDALHRQGARVFAAVGSLHMVGQGGLPALLKKKGYTVERIEFAPATPETQEHPAQAETPENPDQAEVR